jgi:hypothetical protein
VFDWVSIVSLVINTRITILHTIKLNYYISIIIKDVIHHLPSIQRGQLIFLTKAWMSINRIILNLLLWTGYKMYPGTQFLAGFEKQSYNFFYLIILVRHNIIIWHTYCFTCMFFQIQLDHIVPVLVKNVSNTCSAKTYYINNTTHMNCKSVAMSNPTAQKLITSNFAVTWY